MLKTNRFAGIKAHQSPEYVPQSGAGRYWWLAGIVVAGVAGLLLSLTRFGFFQGIDSTLLSQYTTNQSAGPLGYFTRDWGLEGRFYAPLPRLFFWLEFQLFHNTAYGWHIFSALLHTICAVLVWLLAWRLTRRPTLALCAGLFFAAMPVHVTVVGQISAQADLWAALFCLASAVTFLYARQTPLASTDEVQARDNSRLHNRFYYFSIAFYGLALLSKQEAVALPLALLAFDFVTGGVDRLRHQPNRQEVESDREGRTASHLLGYYAPYLVLLALYLLINLVMLGGLGAYLDRTQGTGIPDFLKNNLRELARPFALGGTDGLILIAALLAFLCLTGVQEWEAWQLNNPNREIRKTVVEEIAVRPATKYDDDFELDDPESVLTVNPAIEPIEYIPAKVEVVEQLAPATQPPLEEPIVAIQPNPEKPGDSEAVLATEALVENPSPLAGENTKAVLIVTNPGELRPPYWTLRAAAFGVLWTGAFLLPFVLQNISKGPLYLASAGFALFLAAALAPFGTATVDRAVDKKQARSLFGHFELSYWLRLAAIVVLACVYFAATVGSVNDWNLTTKPVGFIINLFQDVIRLQVTFL